MLDGTLDRALDGALDCNLEALGGTLQGLYGTLQGLDGPLEALEVHNFRPLLICIVIQLVDSQKFFNAMF